MHGEDTVTDEFAKTIEEQFGCQAFAPYSGGCVDLVTNEVLTAGARVPKKAKEKLMAARAATAFQRVVSAGKHLMEVIFKNEDCPTKIWQIRITDSESCRKMGS